MIDKGHVCVPETEFDLALICLTYLSFDQFVHPASKTDIQAALYHGDYAFADYASCFWVHHLIETIDKTPDLPSRALEDLVESIGVLLDVQWASPRKSLVVSSTTQKCLSALAMYDTYDNICQAIVSTKHQLLPTGKGPSADEPLNIANAVQAIRTELEMLVSSSDTTEEQKRQLQHFYGSGMFKCQRLNCQFYWKGFATQAMRDYHVSKHERAFMCTEEGCPQATIGCVTAQDLLKHMESDHGKTMEADVEFPEEEPGEVGGPRRPQRQPATFQCNLCPKRFTRAHNLRSHLRAHTDERPFVCSVCRRAFSRQHDRKRHEILHSGEKKFVCRGDLKNGDKWGCGRRFARGMDSLGIHFRSEAGRICIRPLLAEEAQEKLDNAQLAQAPASYPNDFLRSPQTTTTQTPVPPRLLPSALLAQYPALAGIQWDQLPPGSPEELDHFEDVNDEFAA